MLHLPHYLRSLIALIMMPAALWSGVQAPECECANGEHRFFCWKMFTGSMSKETVHRVEPKHSCCARPSEQQAPKSTCCSGTSRDVASTPTSSCSAATIPCGQCKAIPSSPTSVADRVEAPPADWTAWLPLSPAAEQATLVAGQGDEFSLPASDRLPVTDRVIVLCCLLI